MNSHLLQKPTIVASVEAVPFASSGACGGIAAFSGVEDSTANDVWKLGVARVRIGDRC